MNQTDDSGRNTSQTLTQALSAVLPRDFVGKARYVHTSSRSTDPLFSPLPGNRGERTSLASHFLSISIDSNAVQDATRRDEVIGFALEVFVFTTKHLTTIFVSKADSTGFLPPRRPSPVKAIATAFLRWLIGLEQMRNPKRKIVISLFARSQNQYLFPGSIEHGKKHILDDRHLIRWWARVLDPLFPKDDHLHSYQGFITVPGYDKSETARNFAPSGSYYGPEARWKAGNPLMELARTRDVPEFAPTRCFLPRFPDDPKARFMIELDEEVGLVEESRNLVSPSKRKSGRWKSVQDLERFWEAMEFRQECSSGRAVGFLWLVIAYVSYDPDKLNESQESESIASQDSLASVGEEVETPPSPTPVSKMRAKKKRRLLTGPIVPRKPRIKSEHSKLANTSDPGTRSNVTAAEGVLLTKESYDKAIHTLLQLDFSNIEQAVKSTQKWIAEVSSLVGGRGWELHVSGTLTVEDSASNTKTNGSNQKINDLGGLIKKKRKAVDGGQDVAEQPTPLVPTEPAVNVLGPGMIRKKPKV